MTEQKLNIELLYFDDCPSWKKALDVLEESLDKLGVSKNISLIPVETQDEAEENEFTGSPMIRVNGVDLFPTGQTTPWDAEYIKPRKDTKVGQLKRWFQ